MFVLVCNRAKADKSYFMPFLEPVTSVPAGKLNHILDQLKRCRFSDYPYGHMHGRAEKGGAELPCSVEVS